MRQHRHLRTPAVHRIALVCAVVITLVFSRSVAISVPRASLSHQTTVQSPSIHPKRQTLDRDAGFEFSLLSRTPFLSQPDASFLCQFCADDPLLPFQPDTYYHNRPPPLS
jgi:hypothetical protein